MVLFSKTWDYSGDLNNEISLVAIQMPGNTDAKTTRSYFIGPSTMGPTYFNPPMLLGLSWKPLDEGPIK